MGAELSVDSRPGAGSSFKVRMFFSDAPPSGTAAPAGARIAGYAGPRRRILVTDDDPAHLAIVRKVLAPPGFDLVFADNGEACMDEIGRAHGCNPATNEHIVCRFFVYKKKSDQTQD